MSVMMSAGMLVCEERERFLPVGGLHDVEHLAEKLSVHLPCLCIVFHEEKKRSCICRRHSA